MKTTMKKFMNPAKITALDETNYPVILRIKLEFIAMGHKVLNSDPYIHRSGNCHFVSFIVEERGNENSVAYIAAISKDPKCFSYNLFRSL